MKTLLNNHSILFKFVLALTVAIVSIINSVPSHAEATTKDYQVEIQSMSYIDNTLTIQRDNDLYTFYVDDVRSYYLNEIINVTMDDNNDIIDCVITDQPQIYKTQIDSLSDDYEFATLSADGTQYTFENFEGKDGWQVGDKCKVVIQNGKLLEVDPIPLAER